MSAARDDGGPAVPASSWSVNGDFLGENQGMTLRDYFAATALPGVIGACAFDDALPDRTREETFAARAYWIADAMLRERAR